MKSYEITIKEDQLFVTAPKTLMVSDIHRAAPHVVAQYITQHCADRLYAEILEALTENRKKLQ